MTWQPVLTALEVRLEREDRKLGRHWDWAGGCWCREWHEESDESLPLIAPPWHESRLSEPIAAGVS